MTYRGALTDKAYTTEDGMIHASSSFSLSPCSSKNKVVAWLHTCSNRGPCEHDVQLNQIYDAMENPLDEKSAQRKWDERERIGFKK